MPVVLALQGQTGIGHAVVIVGYREAASNPQIQAGSLFRLGADPRRLAGSQREVVLSRHVGVSRWLIGGRPMLDAVWDTTDTLREGR